MQTPNFHKFMKRLAWVVVLVLWVLILVSSLGTRPEADDYCFAAVIEETGVVGSLAHWYESWAGRYSQQLVHGLLASVEPSGARIGVPLLLAGFVLAWWYLLVRWYPRWDALLVSLAFGAALVSGRPNDEPVFWVAGVTSYWTVFIGAGLLGGALARRQIVLAAIVAFVAVAFSEVGAVLLIGGIGLVCLFWRQERHRMLVVLISACAGFAIVYFAPGTAVRQAAINSAPHASLPFSDPIRLFLGSFATNFIISLVLSLLPGLFLSGIGALLPPPGRPLRRLPLLFLLLVLGACALLAILSIVTTRWGLPLRAIYLLTPLWLAQWFVLGAIIGQRFQYWAAVAPVVGVVLIATAVPHVTQRIEYGQRWDARHAAILAGYRVPGDIGDWDTLTDTEWALACAEVWYGHPIRFVDGGNVP